MEKLTKKQKSQKNKEAIANIIFIVGACLIVVGIIIGFTNLPENIGKAFFACLIGTLCTYISGYIKYGYIKFFN